MSHINMKLAGQNTADPQQRGLRDKANKFMADILVVSTEEITQANPISGNTDAGHMIVIRADIKITRAKDISDNRAREITATVEAFKKTIADLVEAPYTVYENQTWQQNIEAAA